MWPQAYFRGEIEAHQRRDPGLHVQRDACTKAWPKVSVSIMPKMTQDDPDNTNGIKYTHTHIYDHMYIYIWSNGIWIYDIYIYTIIYYIHMDMVRVLEFHLEMILFFGICMPMGQMTTHSASFCRGLVESGSVRRWTDARRGRKLWEILEFWLLILTDGMLTIP